MSESEVEDSLASGEVGPSVQDGSSLQCKCNVETYVKNIFDVPSRNIESAFELVLGLIREQSSEISNLKRAHLESLKKHHEIQMEMESVAVKLVWEKNDAIATFEKLRKEHEDLIVSHEKTNNTVEELQNEIKVRRLNETKFLDSIRYLTLAVDGI